MGAQDIATPDAAELANRGRDLLCGVLETGDTTSLGAAVDLLGEAVAADAEHPDASWWRYWLGLGLARIAEESDAPTDWDAALTELWHPWHAPHRQVDRAQLAADIATVLLRLAMSRPELSDEVVERLVVDLDLLVEPAMSPMPAVDLTRGIARLERFRRFGLTADHVEGLALLRAALPGAPDETPMLLLALIMFAQFSEADDREPALAAIARIRGLTGPDAQDRGLDELEATLLADLWDGTDEHEAKDRILDRLERLCAAAAEPPPGALAACGEMRHVRTSWAEVGADTGPDLDASVRWLDAAAVVMEGELSALIQLHLGSSLQSRFDLRRVGADGERAIACFAEALRLGLPTPTHILTGHCSLLAALSTGPMGDRPTADDVGVAEGALEEGRAGLAAHPDADLGIRTELALELARMEMALATVHVERPDVERVRRNLDLAARRPDPPATWLTQIGYLRPFLQFMDDTYGEPVDDFRPSPFLQFLRGMRYPEKNGEPVRRLLAMVSLSTSGRSGVLHQLETASEGLRRPGSPPFDRFLLAVSEAVRCSRTGVDDARHRVAIDSAITAAAEVSPDSVEGRAVAETYLPMLQVMREMIRPTGNGAGAGPRARVTGMGAFFDSSFAFLGGFVQAGRVDPQRQRQELEALEQKLSAGPADGIQAGVDRALLLSLWAHRAQTVQDPESASRAIGLVTDTLNLLKGPEHPLWISATQNAARACRFRGRPDDLARSRELGLATLRGHAWMVLLQAGTDHAMSLARKAASDAVRLARWCLADRATEDMVAALDAGRGLVLQAAVTTRGVADQLRAAGETALADEWAEAGGDDRIILDATADLDLRSDLRRRVLIALGSSSGDLSELVSTTSIRATLAEQGAAALVYLVPADHDGPGLAVVVPARGSVEVRELPDLDAGVAAALASDVAPAAARRNIAGEIDSASPRTDSDRMADLLAFAWRAAGRELADLADRLDGDDGHPPTLVLVPFGALALVPWHAARPADARGHGLLAQAVVSYIPSARLLHRSSARPQHSDGAVLVIGNPTGDLHDAGTEARSVVSAFHPSATYLGTPGIPEPGDPVPSGPGDAGELLALLASGARPLSLLHLACHARADPTSPARSRLMLADRTVDIEELLAVRRAAPLDIDAVFLAGCSTNVPGADHDEALSLASAFLAAGARTVYGSMWTVPDGHTSRLMFMVHHHLAGGRCSPARALHLAQRWAASPDRISPPTMPPALARNAPGSEDPIAWAGFQHLGA